MGCYLLIILSEPICADHKEKILQKIAKGLLSWDSDKTGCDLREVEDFLQRSNQNDFEVSEILFQHSSEGLAIEVLLSPQIFTLKQCLKNLLLSATTHKHIIHAGYAFTGTGSWMLDDGVFGFQDLVDTFRDDCVQQYLRSFPFGFITVHLHCAPVGQWIANDFGDQHFAKFVKVELNPSDSYSGVRGAAALLDFFDVSLSKSNAESNQMTSTPIVGNIRFNRPTLYIFPSGQGDCSLFGISGFTMLIDGGFTPMPSYWNFIRHLERLDAIMVTRLNEDNLWGVSSLFKKKILHSNYPQIGYIFCNIAEGSKQNETTDKKQSTPNELLVSVIEVGHEFLGNLKQIGLNPLHCLREPSEACVEPMTLYHKVGHGTLEMYILSPPRDNRILKEFLHHWNSQKESFSLVRTSSASKSGSDVAIPLSNLMSICCLIIWRPYDPNDTIARMLFPGSAPQSRIFDGLERIKNLNILKHQTCTQSQLNNTSPELKSKIRETKFSRFRSASPVSRTKPVYRKQTSTEIEKGDSSDASSSPTKVKPQKSAPNMAKKDATNIKPNKQISKSNKNIKSKALQSQSTRKNVSHETATQESKPSNDNSAVTEKTDEELNNNKLNDIKSKNIAEIDSEMNKVNKSEDIENHNILSQHIYLKDDVEPDSLESCGKDGQTDICKDSLDGSEDDMIDNRNNQIHEQSVNSEEYDSREEIGDNKKLDVNTCSDSATVEDNNNNEDLNQVKDSINMDTNSFRHDSDVSYLKYDSVSDNNRCDDKIIKYKVMDENNFADKLEDKDGDIESINEKKSKDMIENCDKDIIEEKSQDLMEDKVKDIDVIQETSKNLIEDKNKCITEGKGKDIIEDKVLDVIGNNGNDYKEDKGKDIVEDNNKIVIQHKSEDFIEDKGRDFIGDKGKDILEDKDKNIIKDKGKDCKEDKNKYVIDGKNKDYIEDKDVIGGKGKGKSIVEDKDKNVFEDKGIDLNKYKDTDKDKYKIEEINNFETEGVVKSKDNIEDNGKDQNTYKIIDMNRDIHAIEDKTIEIEDKGKFELTEQRDAHYVDSDNSDIKSNSEQENKKVIKDLQIANKDEDNPESKYNRDIISESYSNSFKCENNTNQIELQTDIKLESNDVERADIESKTEIQSEYSEREECDKYFDLKIDSKIESNETQENTKVGENKFEDFKTKKSAELKNFEEKSHFDAEIKTVKNEDKNNLLISSKIAEPVKQSIVETDNEFQNTSRDCINYENIASLDLSPNYESNVYLVAGVSKSADSFDEALINRNYDNYDVFVGDGNGRDIIYMPSSKPIANNEKLDLNRTDSGFAKIEINQYLENQNRDKCMEEKPVNQISIETQKSDTRDGNGGYKREEEFLNDDIPAVGSARDFNGKIDNFDTKSDDKFLSLPSTILESNQNRETNYDNCGNKTFENKNEIEYKNGDPYEMRGQHSKQSEERIQMQQMYEDLCALEERSPLAESYDIESTSLIVNYPEIITVSEGSTPSQSATSSSYDLKLDHSQSKSNQLIVSGHTILDNNNGNQFVSSESVDQNRNTLQKDIVLVDHKQETETTTQLEPKSSVEAHLQSKTNEPMDSETSDSSEELESSQHLVIIEASTDSQTNFNPQDWGQPSHLPTPPQLSTKSSNRGSSAKGSQSKSNAIIHVDLAYVPNHADQHYSNSEFFQRIRARYYVFSGIDPHREVFEALIEGKKCWNKRFPTTVIPTHESETLGLWVRTNEQLLAEYNIDVAPSANRCTVNLENHDTKCSAYRVEF